MGAYNGSFADKRNRSSACDCRARHARGRNSSSAGGTTLYPSAYLRSMVNAFWLDRDLERAAAWLVDRHVISGVFECSMVLTTAVQLNGYPYERPGARRREAQVFGASQPNPRQIRSGGYFEAEPTRSSRSVSDPRCRSRSCCTPARSASLREWYTSASTSDSRAASCSSVARNVTRSSVSLSSSREWLGSATISSDGELRDSFGHLVPVAIRTRRRSRLGSRGSESRSTYREDHVTRRGRPVKRARVAEWK